MDGDLLGGVVGALDALVAAGGGRTASALTADELISVNAAFGALRRHVEAAFAPVAAEIAHRSRVELGKDSLAKRQGFRSPVALIQATTGSTIGDAVKLVQVGEATVPRTTLHGEQIPPKHAHVAAAVHAGALSVTAAAAVVGMLDRIAPRLTTARLGEVERELVRMVPGLRADELARLLARTEAALDPESLTLRHEQARAERSLDIRERDGRIRITADLDIETGAPITTVIDAIITQTLRTNRTADDAMGGDSTILDWGRDRRGFTRAQKLALAERDGGCASCGAPTAWTEVHHIDWWSRGGPTDLSNGLLLCTACHHRIHDDGWNIRVDGTGVEARVWFIPPPWIDPRQTARPGGKHRYTLSA